MDPTESIVLRLLSPIKDDIQRCIFFDGLGRSIWNNPTLVFGIIPQVF